jgi:magnesium-transporting ATPase (P-type)
MFFSVITFVVMVANIWARDGGHEVAKGLVHAFIMAVTIVVVAIPEGLPLAVTIALAFSTKRMYKDNCFIRVLAACETMGNATNICSDKTGTLTENSMTVIEGWVADKMHFAKEELHGETSRIPLPIQCLLAENISTNRTAYLTSVGKDGEPLSSPAVIGSKTEGALLLLIDSWKFDYEDIKAMVFDEMRDAYYGFDSVKKRSTSIIFRPDGSVRIFVKGASEQLLRECSMYTTESGVVLPMSEDKYTEIESAIEDMASRALRTLVLAHKDIAHVSMLEYNWRADPPDSGALCVDAVVGIMDPLRDDVTDAVNLAQSAGVFVRMVTGDNINTACAIAKKCGILTRGGLAIEGPTFRALRPRDLDEILPRLQVMARASPDDKMLLVMRLNGHGVPKTREQWESRVHGTYQRTDLTWDLNKDDALPGNFAEWKASRPEGGHVVSVTGDGTNDAPALKAADVGLAMGITGTKVAQSAADIVVLDDRFSSIVGAISWGRCVYDNIRKFLQFQLTTNIVALILVFAAAVSGAQQPITAVQMLWVNLIMDTLGALALGTETPTPSLLKRKPYTRTASLISYPMLRNMAFQCSLQLGLCFWLMYSGPAFFKIRSGKFCGDLRLSSDSTTFWELGGLRVVNGTAATAGQWDLSCSSFKTYCSSLTLDCAERSHLAAQGTVRPEYVGTAFTFSSLPGFYSRCTPLCNRWDFTHGTIIFNTFIWCQIFNEFVSRMLGDELNMFDGIENNRMFLLVSIITIGMQIFIVEVCGAFMQTSGLTANQWLITIGLGAITLPVGVLMRLVKVPENPKDFFDMGMGESLNKKDASGNYARIAKGGSAELLTTLRGLEVARKANYNAKANYAAPLPGSNKFCITDDGVVKLVSALPSKTTLLQGGITPTTTSTSTSASATASTGDKPRNGKSLSV